MATKIPCVSVVGKSNVGKTTFLEKLVRELKGRGYRVATIKHDCHGLTLVIPEKTLGVWLKRGSDVVVISSPNKMAMIKRTDQEFSLEELEAQIMGGVDIILTEGYKHGNKPKIEISRKAVGDQLICSKEELLAVVTDQQFDIDVPFFGLDDARGMADYLVNHVLAHKEAPGISLASDKR
ncbi:MAG: molybdopterin-guanine dinucleotide biosynthesis protein B [Dehalococcoidales bacterium]|nr:molybdopterin-guanine dinucleotide biosynthesis protein B [Dehalococcoidales bacterium]